MFPSNEKICCEKCGHEINIERIIMEMLATHIRDRVAELWPAVSGNGRDDGIMLREVLEKE